MLVHLTCIILVGWALVLSIRDESGLASFDDPIAAITLVWPIECGDSRVLSHVSDFVLTMIVSVRHVCDDVDGGVETFHLFDHFKTLGEFLWA